MTMRRALRIRGAPLSELLENLASPAQLASMSVEEMQTLAGEIREVITRQVGDSGGHLAPNLGVVELTIAMHAVFDFAHDRLLFDVGHQCYPHKLLTGRLPMFGALRTSQGMSGFPEPSESPYDIFRVGHAGTAISTAVGIARGDTLNNDAYDSARNPSGRRVVSLVGDASIVNGVAMEGLNNAGTLKRQLLIVLNDNGMSIARPQGAIAKRFDALRISHLYSDFKKQAHKALSHLPGGGILEEAYHRAGEATKAWVTESPERTWFEHFGLLTVGPVDGHDLQGLVRVLGEVAALDRPVVLHVKTVKGKGFDPAEGDSTRFHSPAPFKVQAGKVAVAPKERSFTAAFGDAMLGILQEDHNAVVCTAAMPDGTGLTTAIERFPERAWDTGICESHAMDMMAGLAKTGKRPFFAVYSTFLQRAFDQAFQEVALQGLPVRLCLDRAGLVGGDGAVHHGFCDVAILRTLPGAVLMAAADEPSLQEALRFMQGHEEGISAVRYPRDTVADRFLDEHAENKCPPFVLGKARRLWGDDRKPDAAVLAFGAVAVGAVQAAQCVTKETGARIAVYDARFAKPVDRAMLRRLLNAGTPVVTVEDHGVVGGFGAAVLETAADMGLDTSSVLRLGIPDRWIAQDSRADQLAAVGIDRNGVAQALRNVLAARAVGVAATGNANAATGTTAKPR